VPTAGATAPPSNPANPSNNGYFPPSLPPTPVPNNPALPNPPADLNIWARVEYDNFGYKFNGRTFERVGFLAGVNLGVGKPGFDPGEQALIAYVLRREE